MRITPADRPLVEKQLNDYAETLAPGIGPLSAGPFFSDPGNIGFRSHGGAAVALFAQTAPHAYDAHLILSPPWRGVWAIAFGAQAVTAVFTERGASVITACIPRVNRPSRLVCRAIGGKPFADTVDNLGRPCVLYRLERAQWAALSAVSPAE